VSFFKIVHSSSLPILLFFIYKKHAKDNDEEHYSISLLLSDHFHHCISSSPSSLKAELEVIRQKVSLQETAKTWATIERGIIRLNKCCSDGGCQIIMEIVGGIRLLSKQLNSLPTRSAVGSLVLPLNSRLFYQPGRAPCLSHFSHSSCPLYLGFVPEQIQRSPGKRRYAPSH
jgi:hypothetical protein